MLDNGIGHPPHWGGGRMGERAERKKVTVGQSSISRFLHHLNLRFKKSLRAAEQDRPDVAAGAGAKRGNRGQRHRVAFASHDSPDEAWPDNRAAERKDQTPDHCSCSINGKRITSQLGAKPLPTYPPLSQKLWPQTVRRSWYGRRIWAKRALDKKAGLANQSRQCFLFVPARARLYCVRRHVEGRKRLFPRVAF
jgi:hypothetical protein